MTGLGRGSRGRTLAIIVSVIVIYVGWYSSGDRYGFTRTWFAMGVL